MYLTTSTILTTLASVLTIPLATASLSDTYDKNIPDDSFVIILQKWTEEHGNRSIPYAQFIGKDNQNEPKIDVDHALPYQTFFTFLPWATIVWLGGGALMLATISAHMSFIA
ncbi:hypothetical protein OEA41_009150 [Lepraria neglecta]|uniref:Uncharacterized protein n=1 Tax=Lepraria neglecta TaxID=209136 RepID=A0AAE0DHD9_9LECA|nr:hypothetical protein OEA41_009150 [Lepraria neglecta]